MRGKIPICLNIARRKLDRHNQLGAYVHYSFLFQHGELLAWGVNRNDEPPVHMGYHKRGYKPKRHSELDCWLRARKRIRKGQPWHLMNIRLNRSGQILMAKPCESCQSLMRSLGCRSVTYTMPDMFRTHTFV